MNESTIRTATVADAGAIAALMHGGMSANVQRITILGSPRLERWVAEQLAAVATDAFLVAEVEGRIAGMASSRVLGATLVPNHLYTHPDFQRRGIARALLAGVVASSDAGTVAVDVFTESHVARRWYAALGFAVEYRRVWLETPLPPASASSCSVSGLAAADAAHAWHGFSTFHLTTTRGTHAIGRLADAVFRAIGFGILADAEALAALTTLDARRTLLCIGAPEDLPADAPGSGRIVEQSERLVMPRSRLAAALADG